MPTLLVLSASLPSPPLSSSSPIPQIDGVDSLNNILLIGMTNRRDMLDEALLR